MSASADTISSFIFWNLAAKGKVGRLVSFSLERLSAQTLYWSTLNYLGSGVISGTNSHSLRYWVCGGEIVESPFILLINFSSLFFGVGVSVVEVTAIQLIPMSSFPFKITCSTGNLVNEAIGNKSLSPCTTADPVARSVFLILITTFYWLSSSYNLDVNWLCFSSIKMLSRSVKSKTFLSNKFEFSNLLNSRKHKKSAQDKTGQINLAMSL